MSGGRECVHKNFVSHTSLHKHTSVHRPVIFCDHEGLWHMGTHR